MKEGAQYKHVVFTDRNNVPDIKPLTGTMKFAQIHGLKEINIEGWWVVSASILPYSCLPCRNDSTSAGNICLYKSDRQIKSYLVIPVQDGVYNDNTYGIRSLTVAQLKFVLSARGLSTTGLKHVLLTRIVHAITSENEELECNDEGEAAVDTMDEGAEDEIATTVASDGEW